MTFRVDWCDHAAARYACVHWHYSASLPGGKNVYFGVWEDGQFIGAVVYGYGANQHLGNAFGLQMTETVELCRVALRHDHQTPVTQILAVTLKMLKRQSPGLRLVISYADVDQGHHGGIYAGGNWVYLGMVQTNGGTPKFKVRGKVLHGRTVYQLFGRGSQNVEWLRTYIDPNAELVYTLGKHKYAYALDDAMRKQIAPLAQPYPKREMQSK
jgi:hypothetical protein